MDIVKIINDLINEYDRKYKEARRSCDPNRAEYLRGGAHALKVLLDKIKEAIK